MIRWPLSIGRFGGLFPAPKRDPNAALRAQIDAACERRRVGRAERQAAARRREAEKLHAVFVRDPIIRTHRPDLIPEGERQ